MIPRLTEDAVAIFTALTEYTTPIWSDPVKLLAFDEKIGGAALGAEIWVAPSTKSAGSTDDALIELFPAVDGVAANVGDVAVDSWTIATAGASNAAVPHVLIVEYDLVGSGFMLKFSRAAGGSTDTMIVNWCTCRRFVL